MALAVGLQKQGVCTLAVSLETPCALNLLRNMADNCASFYVAKFLFSDFGAWQAGQTCLRARYAAAVFPSVKEPHQMMVRPAI